ncbi:Amidophosphoribosyltransferase [Streptomyces sp. enrichment culture]
MCGIVGYIGKRDVAPLLLEGLQRLEYRGYDSAGVVVSSPKTPNLRMVKAKGRVRDLEAKVPARFKGTTGIAHTRWATHGAPSDVNAHPHLDAEGKVAVVHNGIIDNASDLRRSWRRTASSSSPRPTPRSWSTSSPARRRRSSRTRSARPCASSRAPTASP